jgi:hypothetical protein
MEAAEEDLWMSGPAPTVHAPPISEHKGGRAWEETVVQSEEREKQIKEDQSRFKAVAGKRVDVPTDGWCWNWSILAALGMLESVNASSPTPGDIEGARRLVQVVKERLVSTYRPARRGIREYFEKLQRAPVRYGMQGYEIEHKGWVLGG